MTTQKTARRKNHRHNYSNSQSQFNSAAIPASDYESEAYVPAAAEKRSNDEINSTVLRRYVPNLQSIISIAPSTQIYTFSPETSTWEKAGMEGTLFVCELTPSPVTGNPRHCVVVLNRRGLENLIIETSEIENVEITEQFLLITLRALGELKTLGFYMYEDKTDTKGINCQLIMNFWELAMQGREQQQELTQQFGLQGSQAEEMIREMSSSGQKGMGRRLSLTELFQQDHR